MSIADQAAATYNKNLGMIGASVLIQSGTKTFTADYGEPQIDYAGSYYSRAIVSIPSPEQLQYLPEGTRRDETFMFHLLTGSAVDQDFKITPSGTNDSYLVFQVDSGTRVGDNISSLIAFARRI